MKLPPRGVLVGTVVIAIAAATLAADRTGLLHLATADASRTAAAAPPPAVPASVAVVERRDVALWDEYSGRLEAIERVAVRPRVAGAVQEVHFVEGALVQKGDLLVTIDPAPYAAEVARAEAQVAQAQARIALTRNDLERGQQLIASRTVTQRELDQRLNAAQEAEATLRAAEASLRTARLDLEWTEVRAPVAGRVGRHEVTVGNLVSAGAAAPVLTTLVSVDPVYASFDADEGTVVRALQSLRPAADAHTVVDRIPVEMTDLPGRNGPVRGYVQLIDNQVDVRTGTVRVRAVFDNPGNALIPGQFVRLRMGRPQAEPLLLVNERAVGTDQDKKFVLVVGEDNKATYREIGLGPSTEGLRVVTKGLDAGERIVVNNLQRVRPGAAVEPKLVPMQTAARSSASPLKLSEATARQ